MFCSKCGCGNQEGAKFCGKCGTVLLQEKKEEQIITQNTMTKSADMAPPNKKTKKKVFFALVSIILVIAVIIAIEQTGFFFKCYDCGKWITGFSSCSREDGEDRSVAVCENCYDAYYASGEKDSDEMALGEAEGYAENTYYENGESFEYSGETFSFYSTLNMHLNYRDSDEGCYFYEWEEVDSNVEIEVEIHNTLDGYNSSEFETLLQERYIADSKDDTTYDTEKGVLKNGLPMTAVWQKKAEHDYYLEISTYTDAYYYEFQIFSYDESFLIQLYNSINNCVIE